MNPTRPIPVVVLVLAGLAAGSVAAETCKPDVAWETRHTEDTEEILTESVKGSRATRLEICRTADPSGAGLTVVAMFEGVHRPLPVAEGECVDRFAKWGFVRSIGTRGADGQAAHARGVYRVCRE